MTQSTAAERPGIDLAYRVVVSALPLLVIVQAVLAGQHLFEGSDVIKLHGILGNVSFLLAVAAVPLALLARRNDGFTFGLSVAVAAMTFAQVGLGYVGRETPSAAAWHIPLGVTLIAAASFHTSRAWTTKPGA